MHRSCETCGSRMSPFMPRRRLPSGELVCRGCESKHARLQAQAAQAAQCEHHPVPGERCPAQAVWWVAGPSANDWAVNVCDEHRAIAEQQMASTRPAIVQRIATRKVAAEDGWQTDPELGEPHLVLVQGGKVIGYVEREEERDPPLYGPYKPTGRWEWSDGGTRGVARSAAEAKAAVEKNLGLGMTSTRKVAHDSGDGERIYHCPFCGGGQVTGRSDGTVECRFCKTAFTVQVQPMLSGTPQTVNGVPHPHPDMPGTVPGQEPVDVEPGEGTDVNADVEAPEDPAAPPKKPGGSQPPWLKGSMRVQAEVDRPAVHPFSDQVGRVCSWCGGADPDRGSTHYREKFDSIDCRKKYWAWVQEDGDFGSPPTTAARHYLTAEGIALPEDAYLRHLAIRFADDRLSVIAAVRAERNHHG